MRKTTNLPFRFNWNPTRCRAAACAGALVFALGYASATAWAAETRPDPLPTPDTTPWTGPATGTGSTTGTGAAPTQVAEATPAADGAIGDLPVETLSGAPVLSARDIQEYELAFRAVDSGHWPAALRHAERADDPLPAKAIKWLYYQSQGHDAAFEEIAEFVNANRDWPRLDIIAAQAEQAAVSSDYPPGVLIDWFQTHPPTTGDGFLAYSRALKAAGRADEIPPIARNTWRELDMSALQEHQIREAYRQYFTDEDELYRLERQLWAGATHSALRQARRVPKPYRALAEARVKLRLKSGGVDGAIARVPAELKDDPGLAYERLRWRRQKNRTDAAIDLLDRPELETDHPDLWTYERLILSRRKFDDKDYETAYRLLADHPSTRGARFAAAEWRAGWIALRFLDKPKAAFAHFRRMYENVGFPVSRSRAAYWAGRAAAAAGKAAIAEQWYQAAGVHGSSFYGQLALQTLPRDKRPSMPVEPTRDPVRYAMFRNAEIPHLIAQLAAVGADKTARAFIRHLARLYDDPQDLAHLAQLAHDIDRPHHAVYVARQAIKKHVVLVETGFPRVAETIDGVDDPAVVWGIIRQESGFDPTAISHAGARGLMQLMPQTARAVARKERVKYRRGALTGEPAYNVHLGTAYLKSLIERFDGMLPLVFAGYNAGPYRVGRWIKEYGDPRGKDIEDVIDWIEMIPYSETRDYVQRVLENITVYRHQQGPGEPIRLSFTTEGSVDLVKGIAEE